MALWTPAEITTALWLDSLDSNAITLDGSNTIEQASDKSGNDRHFTAPSSGLRPSITDGGIDTAGGKYLRVLEGFIAALSKTSGVAVLMVMRSTAGSGHFFSEASTADDDPVHTLFRANVTAFIRGNASTSDFGANVVGLNTSWAATKKLFCHSDVQRTITARTNGAQTHSFTYGNPSGDFEGNVTCLGGLLRTSFSNAGPGVVWEIVVVPYDLDTILKVEGYLAHRHGIAGDLDSAHPYKNAAPFVGYYFGSILDKDGNPAARTVTVLDSTGQCVATDSSDPVTGAYEIEVTEDAPHTLVFDGEPDRNAQVFANVIPGDPPA